MEKKEIRSRGWCFTVNNYTENDVRVLQELDTQYIVFGYEVAPSTGTPHLQGYMYFKDNKTMSAVIKYLKKNNLDTHPHLQPQKGTTEQASLYCKKDSQYYEKGTLPQKQGQRNDLEELKDEIIAGKSVDEIVMDKPTLYHQYGRTLHKIEDIQMRKKFRNFQTLGEWVYGETGTGKSEYAFKDYNPSTHYVYKYDNNDWQDGYEQQDIVIIDEFRGQLPLNALLTMIDRHPNHFLKRRGREPLPFVSKKVIITSSMSPAEVFKNLSANDKLEQLYRRINIIHL